MKAITGNVILTGISSRVDGSLGLRLQTLELTDEAKLAFLQIQNKNCKILIQPDDQSDGMVEIKGEFDKKTPSQRVRGTMFVLWKHLTDTDQCEISFESFYLKRMEKFIDSIKQELPERAF